jgi:uncharacterized protein YutE (UPF0331/DUF86 family)
MTNLDVIENSISKVRKYLSILNAYKKYKVEEIIKDLTLKGAIERYLYLAIQSTIDLADAVISFKNLRRPATFSESFSILKEDKTISDDCEVNMVQMAKFRNKITHDYEDLNYNIICNILANRLEDINYFLNEIQKNI